ncbi:inosine-uridine preferring nucleoside hydrolase [Kribbella amoyensis]|uniref:Inosine-uridine preferring nucleoside hydrolase n=1 Tax=Kribbella amoyensis TaxID=996641 RepID=A0A561B357_9ACTN|nr:nucleoside hydrolase [Kribbella amoyensis]TWD73295.1 inosine-uridine preferring nucleoside hydrolase [Kribbella amoyensis]
MLTATSLVFDTDLGSDVDGVLALVVVLGSPELALTGVTTGYGDVVLRARMAARVAAVAGRDVGPIAPGRGQPRSGAEVWWAGHEGALLADLERERISDADAIDLLAGSSTVIAVGPLTKRVGRTACRGDAAVLAVLRRRFQRAARSRGRTHARGTPLH